MERLGDIPTFHSEWTPEEIKNQTFRGAVYGFSRKDVRDFLRLLSKVWSRMLDHQRDLNKRIQVLEKEVADWKQKEQEIGLRTQNAEAEANSIRDAARVAAEKLMSDTEEKADAIRARTENWLEDVIARVEQTQRQKTNFLTAFRSSLDSHYELIRNEEELAEPLTSGLAEALRQGQAPPPPTAGNA